MQTIRRAIFYVDGFNLYHAVADLERPFLKWLDLRALCQTFAPTNYFGVHVLYFSAFAEWLPGPYRRHQAYVKALQLTGVVPVLGRFKSKTRTCKACGQTYCSHEEKETDVSIGIHLVRDALLGSYDTAFVVSGDSDIVPAIRMARSHAPDKPIKIVCPPGRYCSYDLISAAGGRRHLIRLTSGHVERAVLPRVVTVAGGEQGVVRPSEYDPPPDDTAGGR